MRGAIAAGHPLTAEVGARVLREGANAVDALLAAAFAAFVTEGPLTGPAGGGFLLVARAGEPAVVLDCFFAEPSRRLGELEEVLVDFADSGTQAFHVGAGSVAVPGLVAGLEEAHRRFASRPWGELVEPALELARNGVPVDPPREFLFGILREILLRTESGRAIYGGSGRIETASFVPTLELLRDAGASAVREVVPELAGDLDAYEVRALEPIAAGLAGVRVLTTPPPSRGGRIVLDVLSGLVGLERWSLAGEAELVARAYGGARGPLTGTTHISVLDADGTAASLSSTLGSGSGLFRGGTQLNNMLGELDVIGLGARAPGERLSSMMAPTVVLDEAGRPRLVIGSAGSVRLAGAIAQVTWRILRGLGVAAAIDAPRLHVEGGTLHLEGGWSDEDVDGVSARWEVVRWEGLNLYFGGVQAVERTPEGTLAAAGDPRRGGVGLVVP